MKTLLAASLLMTASAAFAAINPQVSPREVSEGTLEIFTIFSPEMQRDVTVEVLLPGDYDGKTPRPVVYMHDGQNLFDANSTWNRQAWEMDEAVAGYEGLKPIIVGVHSVDSTRYGDLMPAEVVEMINSEVAKALMQAKKQNVDIKGDKYVDFLALTLKPEIDSHYATLPEMENTSVMGSSMGGLSSFYAMGRHPETFGAAGCLSTHFIGGYAPNEIFPTAFAAYLLRNLPLDGKHRIYFDTGDQTLDANYGPYFDRIMQMISEMGMPDSLFMHRKFPGHAHEEVSWAKRVSIPLAFLLKNE